MVYLMSDSYHCSINPAIISFSFQVIFFSKQKLTLGIAKCQNQAFKSPWKLTDFYCPYKQWSSVIVWAQNMTLAISILE